MAILRKGGKYLEGIRRYLGGSLKVMKVTLENLQTSDMLFEICSGIYKQLKMLRHRSL